MNMKKKFFIPTALLACVFFASCDDKACYCYERVSTTQVNETVLYVHPDTPCSSLGRENRGCLESEERGTVNPEDIAK